MFQLFGLESLFVLFSEYFRNKPSARRSGAIIGTVALAIAAAAILLDGFYRNWENLSPIVGLSALFVGLVGAICVAAVLASYSKGHDSISRSVEDELSAIVEARRKIVEDIRESGGGDVYSSLELNLNQISEYYTINKSQARSSFRIGAAAVVLGFLAVLASVGVLYFGSNAAGSFTVPIVSGAAGLIGQFIGAYCFYLYSQASKQVTIFYGRLSQVQDTMLAIKLCDLMDDKERRGEVLVQIVNALIVRSGYGAAPSGETSESPGGRPSGNRSDLSAQAEAVGA